MLKPKKETFRIELDRSDLQRLKNKPKNESLLTQLDENCELPFGWIYQNKEFIDRIQSEFSYFLNEWIDVMGKDVLKEYAALKSLILYINDAKGLCKSKGECFSKWFNDCVADQKYIEKRMDDLKYLEERTDELLHKEESKKTLLPSLRKDLLQIIKRNSNIKQTDIYEMFDPAEKEFISSELYFMEKEGLIRREKEGRTYALTVSDKLSR